MILSVDPLTLMLVAGLAFGVEKFYTCRWTIVANMVIIWTTIGLGVFEMGIWFIVWAIGLVAASGISIASYFLKDSLPGFFYDITHALYSSKTVLGMLIAATLGAIYSFELAVILILIIWAVAVLIFRHKVPFTG
jgi:hypothetical protein